MTIHRTGPLAVLLLSVGAALTGCADIRTPGFEQFGAAASEQSVAPGINDAYLAADIDAGQWAQRFEVETREIYHERGAIVAAVALTPGQAVADIGAGTGLFLETFAAAVGPSGRVYALDIVPAFVDHMNDRADARGQGQVEARLCSERSIDLPDGAIDVAFVCDVYHHFEYPRSSLASIYASLRPGGSLVIIDFERIPGVSREWVLGHVRAGKPEVITEVQSAGFRLAEEVRIAGFRESYFLRFRKPRS